MRAGDSVADRSGSCSMGASGLLPNVRSKASPSSPNDPLIRLDCAMDCAYSRLSSTAPPPL
eukprot:6241474-Prymnesium_polylepis.1